MEDVYDVIPKSLSAVAKELFRLTVCLKPRLIHQGIQSFENIHGMRIDFIFLISYLNSLIFIAFQSEFSFQILFLFQKDMAIPVYQDSYEGKFVELSRK